MPATTHTLEAARPHLHAHFSRGASPALTIDSGDEVRFLGVPDVSWGLAPPTSTTAPRRKVEPRDPARDNGPCLVGPVAVRGAGSGDVLEIEIQEVRPGPWGWTYSGGGMGWAELNDRCGVGDAPLTLVRWSIDRESMVATDQSGLAVPVRAFPGTIGLAPDEDHASGWVPRACGGNMDCRELVAGSTLQLPVRCEGGMLSVGDGHAAQGDGEASGTAIECMMEELRVRVTVKRGMRLRGPRIRTPDGAWIALGFGATLDAAAADATAGALDMMAEWWNRPRAELLAIASSRASLRITQMVNPMKGVHAVIRP